MKKTLLSICTLLFAASTFGQINSDDPIYNIHKQTEQTIQQIVESPNRTVIAGSMTIDGEILPCDSTNTVLTVTGACTYDWYSDSLGINLIGSNSDLPITLTSDTIVYIQAVMPSTPYGAPMPTPSSPYSGNVRGYWFQAQSDFIITGATVPTTVSSGTSNIAILRFNSGPPPVYSTTTNDFTTLGLWQNEAADTVFTCITVTTGDYIGVLGNRADLNSYASGGYSTTIEGNVTPIDRLGMQFPLSSTTPQDVWTEVGGSTSRIELLIADSLDPASGTGIYPVGIILPVPTTTNISTNYCQGDSVLAGGAYQTVDGLYIDSLISLNGCDSVVNTTLTFIAPDSTNLAIDLCAGDSVLVNGNFETTAGSYAVTLTSAAGCDSTSTTVITLITTDGSATQTGLTLTANTAGATYQWLDCDNGFAPIPGATSQSYTAIANGNYAVAVTENGCTVNSACFAYTTIGIDEYDLGTAFSIFPNP
ncbi:MAG: hypothetical protein ACI837_002315, partial [Crocinitomicaceae bacterium]